MGNREVVITGAVTISREAIVRLELIGTGGLKTTVEAVIDTGFTDYLSLPLSVITSLRLAYSQTDKVYLADGSEIAVDQYEVSVVWDGSRRDILVHCLEGSALIGMSLLYDHLLAVQVVDGGSVSINPFP